MPFEGDTSSSFGEIVLVPFPFTDQTKSKQRPAVIVNTAAYRAERPDIIVMAITSQLRPSAAFGEVWLEGWQDAGLLKPSAIKPVIATLESNLVIRRLGRLIAADIDALRIALDSIIGRGLG